MFGRLFVLICWEKQALVGIYSDEKEVLDVAGAYVKLHNCVVNIQQFDARLLHVD